MSVQTIDVPKGAKCKLDDDVVGYVIDGPATVIIVKHGTDGEELSRKTSPRTISTNGEKSFYNPNSARSHKEAFSSM